MDGSYIPPAHATFDRIGKELHHLEAANEDCSQIGACLRRLVESTDGFYPPDQIVCLRAVYTETFLRLWHTGRINDGWAKIIELSIVTRCINLCEPANGSVRACLSKEELAYLHERYATIAWRTGMDDLINIEKHRARADQLRHPRKHALKMAALVGVATYLEHKSDRR